MIDRKTEATVWVILSGFFWLIFASIFVQDSELWAFGIATSMMYIFLRELDVLKKLKK